MSLSAFLALKRLLSLEQTNLKEYDFFFSMHMDIKTLNNHICKALYLL